MRILEQHDWDRAADIVADAGMVIVSVPIHVTEQVIGKLPPLPKDCILVDLASVKNGPLQAMLAAHDGPVLGLHPMFGPDSGSLAKQVVVWCDGRKPEAYQWFLEQIQVWGARLHRISAVEHDQNMAFIQALRHFATFAYGLHPQKKMFSLSNFWRSLRRFTALSWRWSGDCLPRSAALCRHNYVVRT